MTDVQLARAVASRLLDMKSVIREALVDQLGDAYDCTRVWDAWHYGTMGSNDFVPVTDRIDDIVEAVMAKMEGR